MNNNKIIIWLDNDRFINKIYPYSKTIHSLLVIINNYIITYRNLYVYLINL